MNSLSTRTTRFRFRFPRSLPIWGLLVTSMAVAAIAEPDVDTWSPASNGLRARLVMRRLSVSNGTARIATYLELKNEASFINPLMLKPHRLKFTLTDQDGHDAQTQALSNFSGLVIGPLSLLLPHDSQLRFRIGPTGWAIPADQVALLDLGPEFGRVLPRDGKAYYLGATLTLPEEKEGRSGNAVVWHGTLDLPRVRVPTEPDALDPLTLGPRIDDIGRRLFDPHFDVSDTAVNELSLIDDPRVIPWYVKAAKSNRYELRYAAMERLGRMPGDEALAGLRVGMTTRGADMGHCSTPQAADGIAVNIRVAAAYALARSPHPGALPLLWTLEKDTSKSVRLIVVQTAAAKNTPETPAILRRGTQDADPLVRGEAQRLLDKRSKTPR